MRHAESRVRLQTTVGPTPRGGSSTISWADSWLRGVGEVSCRDLPECKMEIQNSFGEVTEAWKKGETT